jgi:hypothetical protein
MRKIQNRGLMFLALLTAAFLVIADSAAAQDQRFPPGDFGFRYEATRCTTTEFDTDARTYTRVAANISEPPISLPLSLGPNQMVVVYREIVRIGFFDYQPDFRRVVPRPGGETTSRTPSTAYRMDVRSRGMSHTVSYNDGETPRSAEAERLLGLFRLIEDFLNAHPDVKRLGPIRYPCE